MSSALADVRDSLSKLHAWQEIVSSSSVGTADAELEAKKAIHLEFVRSENNLTDYPFFKRPFMILCLEEITIGRCFSADILAHVEIDTDVCDEHRRGDFSEFTINFLNKIGKIWDELKSKNEILGVFFRSSITAKSVTPVVISGKSEREQFLSSTWRIPIGINEGSR